MQAVLLAAGKGTRLIPFTLLRSKAMAPILGKPMVARVLDTILNAGISDVVIVISPEDNHIKDYFADFITKNPNIQIRFAIQEKRLGMAHALNCAKSYISEDFVLSACDSLISADFIKKLILKFSKTDAKAVLSLIHVSDENVSRTGIVEYTRDKKIKRVIEKPDLQDAPSRISSLPLYVFSKIVFNYLDQVQLSKRNEYELQDAIDMLISDFGPLDGVYTDFRYDLTKPEDLLNLNLMFLKDSLPELKSNIEPSIVLVDPVYIGENVIIGKGSKIGPNVYIESDSKIGENTVINNAVLLKGTNIISGTILHDTILM